MPDGSQENDGAAHGDGILIVSPYNAQLAELRRLLPNARSSAVDKFQGQEAPAVIYSMATSSAEDAPFAAAPRLPFRSRAAPPAFRATLSA